MCMSMANGDTIRIIPSINVKFVRQLPMAFPKAKFTCPLFKDSKLTDNSGKEVPKAIIVAPMKDSVIPTI